MRTWLVPLLCAGCATGSPLPLPRTALPPRSLISRVDGVGIQVESVNESNWTEHAALKARLVWDEPPSACGRRSLCSGRHGDVVVGDVQVLDGWRAGNADMYEAMLNTPASRAAARRARLLRVTGYALLGGAVAGAVATTAAIGASGHASLAPAGLSVLGASALGVLLVHLGHRQELSAVREFNQFAFDTGVCVAPL